MAATTVQDEMLYDAQWTKEIDILFIDVLAFQQQIGNFTFGRNLRPLELPLTLFLANLGRSFHTVNVKRRFLKLFKPYTTMQWMLSLKDVMYDPVTKYIHAPARTWEFMFQVTFF